MTPPAEVVPRPMANAQPEERSRTGGPARDVTGQMTCGDQSQCDHAHSLLERRWCRPTTARRGWRVAIWPHGTRPRARLRENLPGDPVRPARVPQAATTLAIAGAAKAGMSTWVTPGQLTPLESECSQGGP